MSPAMAIVAGTKAPNPIPWTAPRSETPMAPPRLSVNVARPKAIPISVRSTEFWNATIVAGIIIPLPKPSGIPMTISSKSEGEGGST